MTAKARGKAKKANGKAKREPIGVQLFRLPPPTWETAEDAREFLELAA